jgi:hypothetical protein
LSDSLDAIVLVPAAVTGGLAVTTFGGTDPETALEKNYLARELGARRARMGFR